jgi:MFS family permease
LWRKHVAVTAICYFVFLSNYITSSIPLILVDVATDFDVSLIKVDWLITFNMFFLGIGNLFWIPVRNKIGKRPILLLYSGIFFVSSVWSAVAKDWSSLFGARIFQGFGTSACEALGPAIVADLYFLHERGLWMGVYWLMIAVGNALGSVFAGLITYATSDRR